MTFATRRARALARQRAKKTRHSWETLIRGVRGLLTPNRGMVDATDATEDDATTPPRTARQVAAHLAATRATSVLAAENARVAELTAARAAVDAAVARRRVAMAAAEARAFQEQLDVTRETRPPQFTPGARAMLEQATAAFANEALEMAVAERTRPYSTRDPLEIPDAQPPESGSEHTSDGEQEDDASERGDGVYMFRASNGVLWQRSPQRGWSAVRYSERERRAANLPVQSHRLRQRVRLAEQHLASLSLAEQDRAMDRVAQSDSRAITLVTVRSLGARQAHEDEPSVEEREVFRALRDDVALETAEEEEEAVTAREIGEVPTREHNLWVIMISLPGCSRATAEACLDRHDGDLHAAFHEAADQQRERWEGIAQIMAQFPWLTEADAETWYEACDASPLNAILTIRRHRRLATNPEYVRHVHDRVTDVIARSNQSDFEATEAEVELLGRRAEEEVPAPSDRPSIRPSIAPSIDENVANNRARVNQLLARNVGAARRYEAAEFAENVITRAADPTRVTVVESTEVLSGDEDLVPPEELRPIAWMERSTAAFEGHWSASLVQRLRVRDLESVKREPLASSNCAVCMSEERPAKVVFGGCGHLCVCQECAYQLCKRFSPNDDQAPCPICRQVSPPVLVRVS